MLVAAALCPHPPLLVPELASGASDELDDLRAACDEVVARLVRTGPAQVILLASGPHTRAYDAEARGTLDGFGIESHLGGEADLPLGLTIGRWLLDRAGWAGAVIMHSVATGLPPAAAADLGWRLSTGPKRFVILAMGDGTYCRHEKAPGHLDPMAEAFDKSVAEALRAGDYDALAAIDVADAERMQVTARTPLQALSGAAAGGRWDGEVLYDKAPYGVGYVVGHWSRGGTPETKPADETPEKTETAAAFPAPVVEKTVADLVAERLSQLPGEPAAEEELREEAAEPAPESAPESAEEVHEWTSEPVEDWAQAEQEILDEPAGFPDEGEKNGETQEPF